MNNNCGAVIGQHYTALTTQNRLVCGCHIHNGIDAILATLHFNNFCVGVRFLVGCGFCGGIDNDGVLSYRATAQNKRKCFDAACFGKETNTCHIHHYATCIEVTVDFIVGTAMQAYKGIFLAPARTQNGKTCLAVNGILCKRGNERFLCGSVEKNIQRRYTLEVICNLLVAHCGIGRICVLCTHPIQNRGFGAGCGAVVEIPLATLGFGCNSEISRCREAGSRCKAVIGSASLLQHSNQECECSCALFPSVNTLAISTVGCIGSEASLDVAQNTINKLERGFGIDIRQCQCGCQHACVDNSCGSSALNPHTSLTVIGFQCGAHCVTQQSAFDDSFSALAPNVVAPVIANSNCKCNRSHRRHQSRIPIAKCGKCFALECGTLGIFLITCYAIKSGKRKNEFCRSIERIGQLL